MIEVKILKYKSINLTNYLKVIK